MDPIQASGVELRADADSLASNERERNPHPSEITESNSNDHAKELSQKQSNETHENKEDKDEKRIEEYLPLYKAALKGDWESARRIFEDDPNALTAKIASGSRTVLHVAVSTKHIQFVEELLGFMPAESVAFTKIVGGLTVLSFAALVGSTKAAKLLVKKNPDLPQIRDNNKNTQLHIAAMHGHKETGCYLLSVTRDVEPSPFTGASGVLLLNSLITTGFYGLALNLLKRYPKLALGQDDEGKTALITLAQRHQAFASGSPLVYWQRIIYHCIPVEIYNVPLKHLVGGDVENPIESSQKCSAKSTHNRFGTLCEKSTCDVLDYH